jgi:hypothetical protein
VDGAGDQFLAGSRLPGDENGSIGLGDTIDLLERLQQGRALADDLVEVVNRFDLFLKGQVPHDPDQLKDGTLACAT